MLSFIEAGFHYSPNKTYAFFWILMFGSVLGMTEPMSPCGDEAILTCMVAGPGPSAEHLDEVHVMRR